MQFLSRTFRFCIFIAFICNVSINTVAQAGPPTITSVDHASMPVGGRQCVNGTAFGPWEGNSTFTLNGTVLNTAITWSDTQFCFQVPASTPAGTATVQLTTADGTSNGLSFTLTPPPAITSITPTRGAVGSQVTITGTNFGATQGNSYVQFDSAAPVVSWSDTQIIFNVPQGTAPGSHTVVLRVDFVIAATNFTVSGPPPAITSVGHAGMPVGGRQCVNGTAFGPWEGNSTFTLNGAVLNTAITWSDTQFCFQIPASTPAGTATVQLTTADGTSNGLSFTLTPPPAITSITPTRGAPESQVTITGTNFGATQGNSYVQFDSAAPVVSWSDTQIIFNVPQGTAPGSHTVVLRVDFVIAATNFTVSGPPPAITSVGHASMPVGGRQCVNGTAFGPWEGNSTFTLNGAVLNTAITWSDTQFCFQVPSSTPAGTATVQLTTLDGISNGLSFTLTPPPAINSITPTRGAPGSQVTITGTNFGATQGNSYVQFDSTAPVVSWSDTQIVFTVPQGTTPGSHTVVLRVDFVIAATNFTVSGPPPAITSVDHASMPVGGRQCVNGTAFGPWEGNSTFTLNGTVLNTAITWSDTQFCFQVPAGTPAGTATVQLTTVDGTSNGLSFTLTPPPAINSITPVRGAVGSQVTITGTNFGATAGNSYVQFDSTAPVVSWSDTQIVFTVPQGTTPGSHTVVLRVDFVIAATNFTVSGPPPAITSVDHASMPVGGRQCVNGTAFGPWEGDSTFTLNGTVLNTAMTWSDTQFCFRVPVGTPTGTATVQLTTLDGISNGLSFTLTPPPAINSITPARGAPGSQVTITGTNFGATQGNSYVQFDSTAPVVSWSDTQIVFTVPQGTTPGSHTVWVRVDFVIAATNFTVSGPPPAITSVGHASMPVGGRQCVNGTAFGPWEGDSTFTLNGTVLNTAMTWSDTQFCFRVPAGTPTGTATVQLTTLDGISNGLSFALTPPPVINSITPERGAVGAQVTITGTNFGATQANSYVQFESTAPVVSWSDTQIVFIVPQGVSPGSHTVALRMDFVLTATDFTITTIDPLLQLSISDTPLQVNLSSPQALDWIHWGRISATEPDRKAGVVPQISDYTILNSAPVSANSGVVAFSWIDGDHSPLVSETLADVEVSNANGGFQITVPADTTVKTLNLYLEISGGTGILQASLSDGSAPPITDQSVTDLDFASKTYSIDFRAASSGQTLTVNFSAANGAAIGLQAAALTSHLPVVSIVSPAAAQQFSAPAGLPVNISATQADAFIANITATGSEGTVLQSSGSPLNASWGPLAAGHYSLTAAATDTAGLSGSANPIEIDVIGQGGSLSIEEVEPSSPIDLESQGSADWLLWGPLNTGDTITDNPGHLLARKSGVAPLIAEYKPIGNHPIGSAAFAHDLCFTGNQQNYCGSDIAVHGRGNGFEINVAADTTPRTLQLYVGTQSADGKIIAFLSDGSAPVATEIGESGGTPDPGNTTLYNIQFAAASPGQALTVRFTLNSDQGGGQIELIGATLSGNPIAPSVPAPQITSVTPGSAPLNARITINGTNFGASQGAGYVQIGDQAQVVNWSDTAIVAVVPAALQVGSTVEVAAFTDHGISNTASLNILSYNIFPASINLLVGQSRTLAARDNNGNPVTGLPWSTSDPTVVGLSTDDPPLITALAPGSAKVWAGDIAVPVTVYAGTVLPAGTPVWTLPLSSGGGSSNLNIVPAVPSDSGADIFALDASGTLTAVSSDGTPVWKVSGIPGGTTAKIIPDFAGSALLQAPKSFIDAQGNFHNTHVVKKIDPNTRQLTDLYTFSDRQSRALNFSDSFARQTVIPHPSGPVFIQDNATVSVIDPSTGQSLANITLDKFRFNSQESREAVTSHMIVAGDGNAYLPYIYQVTNLNSTGPSSLDTSTHTVTHLTVLRVSPDGTSAKIELRTWASDSNCTADPASGPNDDYHCVNSGLDAPDLTDDPSVDFFSPITNAGNGAAVFASVGSFACANFTVVSGQIHQSGCPDFSHVHTLLTYVSQDAVSSQVEQALVSDNTTGVAQRFTPALQREDGSYIGTDATNNLIAVGAAGGALWTQKFNPDANGIGIPITPLYSTADQGIIVTSTNTQGNNTILGNLYSLNQDDGSVILQNADSGAVTSWGGNWYNPVAQALGQFLLNPIQLMSSFQPHRHGNPSRNKVSSFYSKEITVIGWIDKTAVTFPPLNSVNPSLVSKLNGSPCAFTLGRFLVGDRSLIQSDFDRQYANAFLIANSANNEPPGDLIPKSALDPSVFGKGDYRAYNRIQAALYTKGNQITFAKPFNRQAVLGDTVDSCRSVLTPSSSLKTEAHPDNGHWSITPSMLHFFQLNEGRLGSEAQAINMTINSCTSKNVAGFCNAPASPTVAFIYSYIVFDAQGKYTIVNQIFPSYYIYEGGKLVQRIRQHPVEDFIKLNSSSQIRSADIQ